MAEVCTVIAGDWYCSDEGLWVFDIDNKRLGRLVRIDGKTTLFELGEKVCKVFGEEKRDTAFSYWNTSYGATEFGSKMPPIMITDDDGVLNFGLMVTEKGDRNLLVTFGEHDKGNKFKTPCGGKRKRMFSLEEESSGKSMKFSGAGSSKTGIDIGMEDVVIDESGFIEELEEMEKKLKSSEKSISFEPSFNLLEDDDESEGEECEVLESDLRPRGYDQEFWEPLVDDVFGGSNAVEVITCCTNDAFDHMVQVGGNVDMGLYAKVDEDAAGRFPSSQFHGYASNSENSNSQFRGKDPLDGREDGARNAKTNEQFPVNTSRAGNLNTDGPDRVDRRDFSEVLDEEFDIDPMFDDTLFERSEIPDFDSEEQPEDIYVGKTFLKKLDCQIALAIYAIKNMFYFKQRRTKRNSFVVSCADPLCDWRVNAHEMKDSGFYQIRKASLEHRCSIETRSQYTKLASAKVIAAMYRAKFADIDAGPRPLDLQQMLLEELRISCSYSKCWNARESANDENKGTDEDAFLYLGQYLHMLQQANPGTVHEIKTEPDGDGGERFLYMFLAFGASIAGFRYLRPVIVLDGTHLTGKYKGVLLTASGRDANFQIFPLAFAVVDSENEEAWTWFLSRLEGIIADSKTLTFISDRALSIKKGLKTVFKQARHGACIVHLTRNVVSRFKSKGLASLVTRAACAYKLGDFRVAFGDVKSKSVECARYLETFGLSNWTRVYFPGNRYNMMTSNIAESLNNAIRKAKKSPITELVMFIQSMLSRWFGARKKKSMSHEGFITPQVDKVLTHNMGCGKGSAVTLIAAWRYEVKGQFGERHNVDLKGKTCSCKMYDKLKIPCGHALLAGGVKGVPPGQLTAEFYRTSMWRRTYEGMVQPHEEPTDGEIPEEVIRRVIGPPKTRRPSGRPKEKMIASVGEIPV